MPALDPSPVATTFLAASEFSWFHPRGWNPNIFPHLDRNASTATQQAQWLSDLSAYCTGTLFPHAAGVNAKALLFWDGFAGQEFAAQAYNGEPEYYAPEVPQSSVRTITALCAANDLLAGETIRPTELDAVAHTQTYGADAIATYRRKITASVANGCSVFWMDSALDGNPGQDYLLGNRYFNVPALTGLMAEFPACEFYFEWLSADYFGIPNLLGYHDPAGTPGTAGYSASAGYLPFDVLDDSSWDAHAIFYSDQRVDPSDPIQAAALAASYARGARLFLYAGTNFDMTGGGLFTDAQRAGLYALWLANYPFPITHRGPSVRRTLPGRRLGGRRPPDPPTPLVRLHV